MSPLKIGEKGKKAWRVIKYIIGAIVAAASAVAAFFLYRELKPPDDANGTFTNPQEKEDDEKADSIRDDLRELRGNPVANRVRRSVSKGRNG